MMKVKVPIRNQKYTRSFGWPEDSDELEFRTATREDSVALNDLFNRVFRQQRPVEHYIWKAWGCPGGEPVIAYARDRSSGELVSAMTGICRVAWMDGRSVFALQTCETCTDESVRGGGRLFASTVKAGMSKACDDAAIYWAYGGQSNRAARVVGARWFAYYTALTLIPLELRLSLVPAISARVGVAGRVIGRMVDAVSRLFWKRHRHGFRIVESRAFGPEFDRMWEKHRDKFRLSLARDAATLDWRYGKNPAWDHRVLVASRGGEPEGYIIWREWAPDGIPVATVLDLWDGNDANLAEALLDQARRSVPRDCAFLHFSVMQGRPQEEALRRFRSCRPSPNIEADHLQVGWTQGSTQGVLPKVAVDMIDVFHDESAWYYTQGDSDLRD